MSLSAAQPWGRFLTLILVCVHARTSIQTTPASIVPAEHIVAYAIIDGDAELPCNLSSPAKNDLVTLVLWFRESSTQPIFVLDTRKFPPSKDTGLSSASPDHRPKFQFIESRSVLRVSRVEAEDEGEYRCRVDYKSSPTKNVVVSLHLIYPPSKPRIKDRAGRIVEGTVGPFLEGDELNLFCEVTDGHPLPKLYWYADGLLLDTSFVITEASFVRNEFRNPALTRKDLLTTLECRASNSNISKPSTNSVIVEMNLRPLSVQILTSLREPLAAGKAHEVTCVSRGSRPPASISWFINEEECCSNRTTHEEQQHETTSVLQWVPDVADDGKFLICMARNPRIAGAVLQDKKLILLKYKPIVKLRFSDKMQGPFVPESSDVTLLCEVNARPMFQGIQWKRNGKLLRSTPKAPVSSQSTTLTLRNVSRNTSSSFTCVATNPEGSAESLPLYMAVQYAPTCTSDETRTVYLSLNEVATIYCDVEADPPPVSYQWIFNRLVDKTELPTSEFETGRNFLNFSIDVPENYGVLECTATNDVGKQKAPCRYNITYAELPKSLKTCRIWNTTITSLEMECDPGNAGGGGGGLPQEYVIHVYEKNSSVPVSILANLETPYFHVTGLNEGHPYVVEVYARNVKGVGDSKFMEIRMPRGELREPRPSSISNLVDKSPLLEITLSCMGGTILFLVVTCLVVRFCARRNRRPRFYKSAPASRWQHVAGKDTTKAACSANPDLIPSRKVPLLHGNDCESKDKAGGSALTSLDSISYSVHAKERSTSGNVRMPWNSLDTPVSSIQERLLHHHHLHQPSADDLQFSDTDALCMGCMDGSIDRVYPELMRSSSRPKAVRNASLPLLLHYPLESTV